MKIIVKIVLETTKFQAILMLLTNSIGVNKEHII